MRLPAFLSRRERGEAGERAAERFLTQRGLRLIERNYRCRYGEIDLVMRAGETLVFIEVRLRRDHAFGGAAESITPRKQRRIQAAAQHYLAGMASPPPCRFDAVLLNGTNETEVEWLVAAFDAA